MADTWQSLIDRIMPLINLTNTKAKTEQTGLVRPLKNTNLRPFDTHFDLPPTSKATTVVNSEKLDSTSSTATLTLALLPPVVEVTLNLTISLRHSSRQRRASFNEVKIEKAPSLSLVNNQALPSLATKSLANSSTQKRNFSHSL
jgi:hypothetical protein